MFDWNDLRYFLAVAQEGSTLAAARTLRVSQTTVARRLAALEMALGVRLFDKRQAGYALTPIGEGLMARAAQVDESARAFADAAAAQARDLSGTVKITTEDVYAIGLLSPFLRELREAHPSILIELDTSQKVLDLGAGEADVAVRSTSRPQAAGIVGRRLCKDDWTLYCSRDYADRNGLPTSPQEMRTHAFVGGGGGNLWVHYQAWLRKLGLEDQVTMHHASSTGLLSAARAGVGIAVLPCIVADSDPDLVRCLPPPADHQRILWLVTHERVRNVPRVRAVIDFLYERLSRHIRQLEDRLNAKAA